MRKILILLVLVLTILGCNREIVLKKSNVLKAPYDEKLISKGDYKVNIYRLKYPKDLKGKQDFFEEFNVLIQKYYLKGKKVNFLISEDLYKDINLMSSTFLLSEEKIYEKSASTLNEDEKNKLSEDGRRKNLKFSGTTQEYLNFQVEYLLNFLDRGKDYSSDRIYTEREKSALVDEIKDIRKKNFTIFNKVTIQFILEIEKAYAENKSDSYWGKRDIQIKNTSPFNKNLSNYSIPIYLKNLEETDIEALLKEEYKINGKAIIIENNKYFGYKKLNNGYLFFTGGNKELRSYEKYGFNIIIKDIELEDMINLENSLMINDILGGTK
jgi:hypothetical protein